MTLQQIRYAMVISETGSMNKAAEKLYISQPSLTSAIKSLEQEVGINIFLRTSKGMKLTKEGMEFLTHARKVYIQYELLMERYEKNENIKQRFSVSAQHYPFAERAFINTIQKFNANKYDFLFCETSVHNAIDDVGDMRSEVGVIYLNNFNKRTFNKMIQSNSLKFYHLIKCEIYVLLSKKHPLSNENCVGFEQLSKYPYIDCSREENNQVHMFEKNCIENLYSYMIEVSDWSTMMNIITELNGYTICSKSNGEKINLKDFKLITIKDDEKFANTIIDVGYIVKKDRGLSDIAKTYIEELKNNLNSIK